MSGPSRIAVVGAAGRTGGLLARLACAEGHIVTVLARDHRALEAIPDVHRAVVGDATEHAVVAEAVREQDAVIIAVSSASRKPDTTVIDITRTVITAMGRAAVRRVVITSSRNITATRPWLAVAPTKWMFRHVYADLARSEQLVRSSGLDWTIVRAVMLTDDPARGGAHVDTEANATGGDWKLPRADYARVLLDTASDASTVHRVLGVDGLK